MLVDDELLLKWEPKIQKTLNELYKRNPIGIFGFERRDIAQELRIAIIKAANSFDPSKGTAFSTYLYKVLENTKRTLMSLEYRHYRKGRAVQEGNLVLGESLANYRIRKPEVLDSDNGLVWTNAMIGGLFTFFKEGGTPSNMQYSERGGGIITSVFKFQQTPIGAGDTAKVEVYGLTVDSDVYLTGEEDSKLTHELTPYAWNEVVEYSDYNIRIRKMPGSKSLDDKIEMGDEDSATPLWLQRALHDANADFWQKVEIHNLITSRSSDEKEQSFLDLRMDGFTMDEITKQLGENSYKIRQSLREKFSDLADEYEINH